MTSESKPKVFFVVGGPGSGKGTACAKLVTDFGYTHFSAGDLLREAARSGESEIAKKISEIINSGNIVPSEITVQLLFDSIAEKSNPRGYVIDGFPRKIDQALMFENDLVQAKGIIYLDCAEATMRSRILDRASENSGRADDNPEIVCQRFRTNVEQCMPVIEKYKSEGRLFSIDGNRSREEVYSEIRAVLMDLGEVPLS